jgi:hypothetical protein
MSTPQTVQLRRFLPSIVLNAVVPLVVYALVRPYFADDVAALIIAGAIPLAVTVVGFVLRRKVDVVGVISVAGFVVAVAAQLLTGGDGLIVKVQGVIITGPIGVLFLLSALVGRPLVGVIFQFLARRNPAMRVPTRGRALAPCTQWSPWPSRCSCRRRCSWPCPPRSGWASSPPASWSSS